MTFEEIKEQLNKVKDNEHINIDDAALEIDMLTEPSLSVSVLDLAPYKSSAVI